MIRQPETHTKNAQIIYSLQEIHQALGSDNHTIGKSTESSIHSTPNYVFIDIEQLHSLGPSEDNELYLISATSIPANGP